MIGIYQNEFPRGFPTRGWDPQNPTTLSNAFPVASDPTNPGAPQPIKAGMIMSLNDKGTAWELGVSTVKHAKRPAYIAFAQDHADDWNVIESDSLVGLPCSGQFRLATPYFARQLCTVTSGVVTPSGEAYFYKAGTPITYALNEELDAVSVLDGATSKLVARSCAGMIRPAKAGEPVIGVIASTHSGVNGSAVLNATQNGAWALQQSIGTAVDSSSKIGNAYLVQYDTTFKPTVA